MPQWLRRGPAAFWQRVALRVRVSSSVLPLRLVQVATMGALGAALAAELAVAPAAQRSADALFLPLEGTLHPLLPTFVGVLVLPLALGAALLALARIHGAAAPPRAAFAVAVYGAVPMYVALPFVVVLEVPILPLGGVIVGAAFCASVAAWAGGCRHVLRVTPRESAQFIGLALLATFAVTPMMGALLATLA